MRVAPAVARHARAAPPRPAPRVDAVPERGRAGAERRLVPRRRCVRDRPRGAARRRVRVPRVRAGRGRRAGRRAVRLHRRARHRPQPDRRRGAVVRRRDRRRRAAARAAQRQRRVVARSARTGDGRGDRPRRSCCARRRRARRGGRRSAAARCRRRSRCSTRTRRRPTSPRCSARSSTSARGSSTGRTPRCSPSTRPASPLLAGHRPLRVRRLARGGCPTATLRGRRRLRSTSRAATRARPAADHDLADRRQAACPSAFAPVDGRPGRRAVAAATPTRSSTTATRSTSGDVFNITADVTEPPADLLRRAPSSSPPGAEFLALPADFPDEVAPARPRGRPPTADDAVRPGAAAAELLPHDFTYDLDVQAGHSNDAILSFLRIRRGYCEQFAGTFAAMARSLGHPGAGRGRVHATASCSPTGCYHVYGRHAHAWPEVWFDGVGWVAVRADARAAARPAARATTGVAARAGRHARRRSAAGRARPSAPAPPTTAAVRSPPITGAPTTSRRPSSPTAPAPAVRAADDAGRR